MGRFKITSNEDQVDCFENIDSFGLIVKEGANSGRYAK